MAAKKTRTKKAATRKSTTAKKAPAKPAAMMTSTKTAAKKMSALKAAAKGYWKSPSGATPHGTLYAALLRDIQRKSDDSRFVKAGRELFALRK